MTDKVWYYSVGGERKGPVDEGAMRALVEADVVQSETLIWSDGMDDWVPAYRHISGLVPPVPGRAQRVMSAGAPAATGGGYAEPIGMGGAFSKAFSNFGNFRDRASRGEFWWFVLASILVGIVCSVIDFAIFEPVYDPTTGLYFQLSPLNWLWSLIALIPTLAVGARRLHDINRSGWWQLIALTFVGIILLIVWWAQEGDKQPNNYG